ncbi:MAG: hypothetical protein Alpg2KO_07970 [Alphaproteobacteria bacterium]
MAHRHGYTAGQTAISSRMVSFLEKLPRGKQSATVKRLMSRLSDSTLEQFSARARVAVMQAMWQKNGKILDRERLSVTRRLLGTQKEMAPGLADQEAKGWTEFSEKVMTRLPIDELKANWGNMDKAQRVDALQQVATMHAEAFDTPEATVNHKAFKKQPNGFLKTAEYRQPDIVNINIMEGQAADSFYQALTYTAHELTHHWQSHQAALRDTHPPKSEEFAQAEMFRMSFLGPYYIEGRKDPKGYRDQLIEQHAFGRQANLMQALRRRDLKTGLSFAPNQPASDGSAPQRSTEPG